MISIKLLLYAFTVLIMYTRGSPLSEQTGTLSQITIDENLTNTVVLPTTVPSGSVPFGSNFIHQGTNFFFNPKLLLGTFNPSEIEALLDPANKKKTQILSQTEDPKISEIDDPEQKTPEQPLSIKIGNSIVVQPPLLPTITINESIIMQPPPTSLPFIQIKIPDIPKPIKKIPAAPILPPLVLPKIPIIIEEAVKELPPCDVAKILIHKLVPFPKVCARHIIVERVLPDMIFSKKTITKSVELTKVPTFAIPVFPQMIVKD